VSEKSGLSNTLLKKMLPIVGSLVMGALNKKVLDASSGASNSRSSSGGLLTSLLDNDRDGSIWDDVLDLAARTMLR
jgi:hypothetical protein